MELNGINMKSNRNNSSCGTCDGFWKFLNPPHYNFFDEDCNLHDRQYSLGGNGLDRKISDLILLNNMRKRVKEYFYKRKFFSRIWFLLICKMYYLSVRIFGRGRFFYHN